MTTLTVKHFDTLNYVQEAKKLGTSEDLAAFQAKQIEQAIEVAIAQIETKELATKGDIRESELRLQKEIALIESKLIKWILGTGIGTILAIAGLLKYIH